MEEITKVKKKKKSGRRAEELVFINQKTWLSGGSLLRRVWDFHGFKYRPKTGYLHEHLYSFPQQMAGQYAILSNSLLSNRDAIRKYV